MESIFSGIKYHIKKISHECKAFSDCKVFPECEEFPKFKVNYNDDSDKIKFVSDDSLPLRCVLKQGDIFYPQVHLDDALYQL